MNWLIFLFLLQVVKAPLLPDMPTTPGVFYKPTDTDWIKLPPAAIVEMKIKGMDMFIQTGGYTNLKMSIVCRGARAPMRISIPNPAFYIREAGSIKDVMIIRLTQKKDKRTFKASFTDATVENKSGFREKDIRKVSLMEYPDGSYSVAPAENLELGEYLLVFGKATEGYDFGIE